jgi:hypothetical protein
VGAEDDAVEVTLLVNIIVEIEDDVDGIMLLEELVDELVETVALELVELEVDDEIEDVLVEERTTLDDVVELDVDDSIELLLEVKVDEERTLDEMIEEGELLEGMVEVPDCVLDNEVLDADVVLVDTKVDEELETTGAAWYIFSRTLPPQY